MASSTVVAFKDALITRLQARPGLADATCRGMCRSRSLSLTGSSSMT